MDEVAGRVYVPTVYTVRRRQDIFEFLCDAVEVSGGKLLYRSDANHAPIYLGVQDPATDERMGILCYPFRCNPPPIQGRAPDEHRLQIRYGNVNNRGWRERDHPIGRDVAEVDTTLVVGAHLHEDLIIGLDPILYGYLPMGISVEFKQADVDRAQATGWHAWERVTMRGTQRGPRVEEGLETLVAVSPDRFLDFVRLERYASALGLDPALRLSAAEATSQVESPSAQTDAFLREMGISEEELVHIIRERKRLAIAVWGGVAEHHLQRQLLGVDTIGRVELIDRDGEPDLEVELAAGRVVLVECKNAARTPYADGTPKVEIQKTRSQRGDPAGRLYRPNQFDVVAVCLQPVEKRWEFRFKAARLLDRHETWTDRIRPMQRVDDTWARTLHDALAS